MERTIDRLPNKSHIELRSPQVGVSVRERTSAPRTIGIKFETAPFEIGGQLFNGAVMERTLTEAHALIRQLQRGITLLEKADHVDIHPDDDRYK